MPSLKYCVYNKKETKRNGRGVRKSGWAIIKSAHRLDSEINQWASINWKSKKRTPTDRGGKGRDWGGKGTDRGSKGWDWFGKGTYWGGKGRIQL